MTVAYPYMRLHAKHSLRALADEAWVQQKLADPDAEPPDVYHLLSEALNSLDEAVGTLDFGPLSQYVGSVLADVEEANLVTEVIGAWARVDADVGSAAPRHRG